MVGVLDQFGNRHTMPDVKVPDQIKFLVNAVGVESTLSFIDSVGGRRIWVPTTSKNSRCAQVYGDDIAAALSDEYGGSHYDVPLAREWRALLFYSQGMTMSDIASRLGCSRSAVVRIIGGRTRKIITHRKLVQQDKRQMFFFC
ncbi:hypothetical protein ACI01nite_26520 [Acetobacter cibinongensis]|uniref:Uncharacterized protein n=1 Tax=Acetobacter cibinongensis TaxID=146475 RepID=A0A0D6N3F8_9PROT|nr:helix-turn-helix domain-containing protein [Acetobacter cibinongensis]GAN60108.1 hypothetical protein Abci_009_013 [Acetobacter cibinongensis]GBQ11688.1 hypothetical protein AA0482_0011 [Acetobacter cibinongensis NRIC 0482]GEL60050.1 hypothetical protein ACI01nite_26520 [Acetobacter cibinongensis]